MFITEAGICKVNQIAYVNTFSEISSGRLDGESLFCLSSTHLFSTKLTSILPPIKNNNNKKNQLTPFTKS